MPIYLLNDVPESFDVELSDEFVNALDKINRPWKYDDSGRKRGRNVIWKANGKFFKRLWGGTRYRTDEGRGSHRGGDNGAFIRFDDVPELLNLTNAPWWLIEENIISMRKHRGKSLSSRFPIKPDKWWAKLMGFYWSSGTVLFRTRGNWEEVTLRLKVDDEVIPMLREIGKHIGDNLYESTYLPLYDGGHKHAGLRAGVRTSVLLSVATWEVLKKFGVTDPPPGPKKTESTYTQSRTVNPVIPDWIKDDSEMMRNFIEGYINGLKGHSIMACSQDNKGITTQVLIRFSGSPLESVKKFGEDFAHWFEEQGISGYFRQTPRSRKGERGPEFELILHNRDALVFLYNNFEIRKPDMRARLLLRVKALSKSSYYGQTVPPEEMALMEALRGLYAASIVIMGVLYEAPRTEFELLEMLRIYPERLRENLALLEDRGVIALNEEGYEIDLSVFIENRVTELRGLHDTIAKQISTLSVSLIFRCVNCGRTYLKEIPACGNCGSTVEAVERKGVMFPLVHRMHRYKARASKLESVNNSKER